MALKECVLFLSIETSGNMYPAADFLREAKVHGVKTVEINPEASVHHFAGQHLGPAPKEVPVYVDTLGYKS